METPHNKREWYQKKRYIIPAVLLGLLFILKDDQPSTLEKVGAEHFQAISAELQDKSVSDCHPSYSGCLNPNASDYDCAGGSGNGPYFTGPVQVIGPDVFGLDRDGDGWGCE
jgi:hypothetical protein